MSAKMATQPPLAAAISPGPTGRAVMQVMRASSAFLACAALSCGGGGEGCKGALM